MVVEDICKYIRKKEVPLSDFERGLQSAAYNITLGINDPDISVSMPVEVENIIPIRTEYRCTQTDDLCVGYRVWYSFLCRDGFSKRVAKKCESRD